MYIKSIKIIASFLILLLALNSCANNHYSKLSKRFKHNTPLIKEDIRKMGSKEIDKTVEMGPQPFFEDDVLAKRQVKRTQISSERVRNYLLIPDEFELLKQSVSFKFQNLDYKETMILMGKVGEINILVGEEVGGAISAELIDVPWDKAFQALLDMKNYAADIDVASNLIRIHDPATLTSQENYKSARAAAVRKKVELEDSVEPIVSEIFRLYYISPTQAKKTINELFTSTGKDSSYSSIQVTEEATTRSIIVRGKEKDLDVVDKLIREIDIKTKQVLIEAFIVEANSDFERALGSKLGGYYSRGGRQVGGIQSTSSSPAGVTGSSAALGSATDSLTDFTAAGKTSGIGILKRTGSAALRLQLPLLNPKAWEKLYQTQKFLLWITSWQR